MGELLPMLDGFLDCGEGEPPRVTAGQLRKILRLIQLAQSYRAILATLQIRPSTPRTRDQRRTG